MTIDENKRKNADKQARFRAKRKERIEKLIALVEDLIAEMKKYKG